MKNWRSLQRLKSKFLSNVLRTQPTTECSKLTIEMLDQGVKFVQS